MSTLQTLRNAQLLTRLVLVWFALFVGAAVASPWVKPQAAEMVCTAMGGMKMVVSNDGAGDAVSTSLHAALDCPVCLPLIAPPQNLVPVALPPGGLSHVLQPRPAARLASLLGQPWQARAPPVLSA
jgi:hypothetical protein